MKLIGCYVENFGKLHGFSYSFDDGVNLILEKNGWGKSTFAAFIKAMFYGMDYTSKKSITENERKRYMPWQGGNYGGYVIFDIDGKVYRIQRFFGAKDKDDTFELYDEVTGVRSNVYTERAGEEIFGIDAFAFERSIYIPQESKSMAVNDSLSSKLNNATDVKDTVSFEKAIGEIENRIKYYKKTGDRGRIPEIEMAISQLNNELVQYENRTESVDKLREEKLNIDDKRAKLVNKLKDLQEEIKSTSEYDAMKAKKAHYDMLKKNYIEAKNNFDSINLFFDKVELMEDLDDKMIDYKNLEAVKQKHQDESENVKELEYRKHGIESQFGGHRQTPVVSFVIMMIGLLFVVGGVFIWAVSSGPIYIPGAVAAIGGILFLVGIITMLAKNGSVRKDYYQKISEVDEEIGFAKASLKDFTLKKEQLSKSLENYIGNFQVEQPSNILKSLLEIEGKISEYDRALKINAKTKEELDSFTLDNDMEKIQSLKTPLHTLSELQKQDGQLNRELMDVMERRNSISRRIDSLTNSDEDENDLMAQKDIYVQELGEAKRKYELLAMTMQYLNTANEQFKMKYIQDMKDAFSNYVELFNGCKMNNISIDIDLNVSAEDFGVIRNAECYSTGYKDMLSLCTRFAIIEAIYKDEKPFIILDDPFVNLDDDKLAAAKDFVNKVSRKHQIIYFTCHDSRA